MTQRLTTDVLVVGAGPAGASAALFLASAGIEVTAIAKTRWTASTPRSHITNQRTMEVLRDVGIEARALVHATPQELMANNIWCENIAGAEIARLKAWGNPDERLGDYAAASPCRMCDIPQDLLEPILVCAAQERGARVRFEHEVVGLREHADGVQVDVLDRATGAHVEVHAKYVVGADGARSAVAKAIDLPFDGEAGIGGAVNVVFNADLSGHVAHRPGVLFWVVQPGADHWAGSATVRMVRPWNRWLAIFGYDPASGHPGLDHGVWLERVRDLIGDASVDVEIASVDRWQINRLVASEYSRGRVLCAGDAVHRHPPTNGLGSNTSIQDAHNLAWKLALVVRGHAHRDLLESYDAERRPVGKQVVDRAIRSLGEYEPLTRALGLEVGQNAAERAAALAGRLRPGPDGDAQRDAILDAVQLKHFEYNAHGVELGAIYRSRAVVADGLPRPEPDELIYQPTTYPGARLPHAWVGDAQRTLSTLDLVGKNRFTVLTGPGGGTWHDAAAAAAGRFKVPVVAVVIGPSGDVEDLYGDWRRRRQIADSGCLLVRPDGHVGWRWSQAAPDPGRAAAALTDALARMLGWPAPESNASPAHADNPTLQETVA